jgi:hypothetical protein
MERIRHLLDADTSPDESENEEQVTHANVTAGKPKRRSKIPEKRGNLLINRNTKIKRLQHALAHQTALFRKMRDKTNRERQATNALITEMLQQQRSNSEPEESAGNESSHDNTADPLPAAPPVLESREKIPAFKEFGSFPNGDRLREFRDWMVKVYASLAFAPHFTEQQKYDHFTVYCGPAIDNVIKTYDLEPKTKERRFTDLIANIDAHFVAFFDPALDHQALMNCRQRADESAEDFYVRLSKLTRHRIVDANLIRSHFLTSLRDQEFANLAITSQWPIETCVQAAARHEATSEFFKKNNNGTESPSISAVDKRKFGQTKPRSRETPRGAKSGGDQCRDCGITIPHRSGTCPAKVPGRTCSTCSKPGHFAKMCRSKAPTMASSNKQSSVNQVKDDWE